ncbi:metal-binding protein [Persephonella atlantica]|uniref:Metal-binding protein n=1 Tax=Persephonella atlantica TaxID=2699429 RepID=A0ABS1GJF9_9AQUI|nr:metal-binding protein [Persephonella atlantica]
MAAGRTHDIVNLSILPVAVYYLQPENFTGFISGYLAGTFLITPDNDIYHSRPNRRWKFLRFLWYPYTRIFSHRGISHLPVVGSIAKIVYLVLILAIVTAFVGFSLQLFLDISVIKSITDMDKKEIFNIIKSPFVVSFFIGLVLAEIIHVITDVVYSSLKKVIR